MINKENAKETLFNLRCKYGKTQEQVADGSLVSRITVNGIESGNVNQKNLRAGTLFKLNAYFKTLGEKI